MNVKDRILVSLLAAQDMLYLPLRTGWDNRAYTTVLYERRSRYRYSGIPWNSSHIIPSGTEADRKVVERQLSELKAKNMLQKIGRSGIRTTAVRLTGSGDQAARALCYLPSIHNALPLVKTIEALKAQGYPFVNRAWIPEIALTPDRQGWGDGQEDFLCDLAERMTPLLVRGWVESNCDVCGHGWYALTGKAIHPPDPLQETPRPSEEAEMYYYQAMTQERNRLRDAKPDRPSEIGCIPMPASCNCELLSELNLLSEPR